MRKRFVPVLGLGLLGFLLSSCGSTTTAPLPPVSTTTPTDANFTGTWSGVLITPSVTFNQILAFKINQNNKTLSGRVMFNSEFPEVANKNQVTGDLTGVVNGDKFSFTSILNDENGMYIKDCKISMSGYVENDSYIYSKFIYGPSGCSDFNNKTSMGLFTK